MGRRVFYGTFWGRGRVTAAILLSVCLFSCGLPGHAAMLDAAEQNPLPGTVEATLYFRYRDTTLLAREKRQVSVPRNVPAEQAIAAALVEGPGSLSPHLTPLFPPGTQVLNVSPEGETLFVTFNAELMNRYADEAQLHPANYRTGEGRLRRRLAMASLVNTLTESGRYRAVQVLVRDENYISTSMRLSSRYYLEEAESFPDPLTRQEETIHTPQHTAEQFMSAWQEQDWQRALRLVGGVESGRSDLLPTEHELSQRLSGAPRMVHYALTPGVVALDGQSAVVSISYTLLNPDGTERSVYARPFRLLLQEGIFLVPFDTALRVLELSDE